MGDRARVESTGLKPLAASRRLSVKLVLASVWLAFSLALASWWMVFGLNQLEEMRELTAAKATDPTADASFKRQHRMLLSEGVVLLVLLLGGGIAILYGIQVERKRARQVEEFFASFTHDLKTSLASLRVQTESLHDDLTEQGSQSSRRLLDRIMGDAGRLETQLENALFLADTETSGLLVESVDIKNLVDSIAHHWPKMVIEVSDSGLKQSPRVLGDRRALESVVRNLAQNSSRHGQATKLAVAIEKKSDYIEIRFQDNGVGFNGDYRRLGIIFDRQSGTSGSGIGLYLVSKLVERMQGEVRIEKPTKDGFCVTLRLLSADEHPERPNQK